MQYILSEEEFLSLKNESAKITDEYQRTINELCHTVADNVPIEGWHATESPGGKRKWGCVALGTQRYCDLCPVSNYCKSNKRYSK